MSATVDNRVVEMQFDNAHFEKNVSTSLDTLEKLKQSLNLKGMSKGLEEVNAAAKNCNMEPLSAGVDAVRIKFSALQTMAVTALANITNTAVNAGKRIVSALTIDPVKTGFDEYETKINAIQTIMSNTASKGTTMADVTRVIDELNTYADKTIYNFSEMTRNIGTFTAAGVGLEDSAAAIQGIANLAAASGSTSQQASTAMYQLSQALAAGTVKLMDWNSVVNAGMGGEKFQNALKETARDHGIAVDEIIKKQGSFRESLTEGWISADILNETLKKFTVEGAAEYAAAMMKSGKWTKEQADALKVEAQNMEDAATKVKTLSQLWSTLKESAQSGWGKTFELILGDFEEARVLFTDLYEIFGGIIDRSSESRNSVISEAMGSNWDKLVTKINEAGMETDTFHKNLEKVLKENGHDVDKLKSEYGSLEEIFTSGKLKGSTEMLQEALKTTTESLIDFDLAGKSIEFGAKGKEVEKVQKTLKQLGYDLGDFGELADGVDGKFGNMTKNAIIAFQKANNLTADGIIGEETLAALDKATTKTETLSGNFQELISTITEPSGRKLLIESFMNSLRAIGDVLGVIGKAWRNVFKGFSGADLKNIIKRIHEFTENLGLSEERAEKLQKTFEGIFTVLKTVKGIIGEVISTGVGLAFDLFGPLLDVVLSVTSAIGAFVKKALGPVSEGFKFLADAIQPALSLFVKFIEYISESFGGTIDAVVKHMGEWISKFEETEAFQKFVKFFKNGLETIRTAFKNISLYIKNLKLTPMVQNLSAIGKWLYDSAVAIKNSEFVSSILSKISGAFSSFVGFITNLKLPDFKSSSFYKFLEGLQTGGLVGGLKTLSSLFLTKFNKLKNDAIIKFSEFYVKYGPIIQKGFDAFKNVVVKIVEFIFGTKELSLPAIMDVVEKLLKIAILFKTLNIVSDISGALSSVGNAVENVGKATKWRAIGEAFKSMAIALGVFTACIVVLNNMKDPERAKKSARILEELLLVMGGIIALLILLSKSIKGSFNLAATVASVLGVSIALAILVGTLKSIDSMDLKNPKQSIGMLAGVLMALAVAITIVGRFCGKGTLGSAAAIVTMLAAVKMIPQILEEYTAFNWNACSAAIPKLIGILVGLAIVLKIATSGLKAGANATGLALLVIGVVLSLKIILGVIAELGKMNPDEMAQGIEGVAAVLALITGMLVAIGLTNKGGILKKGEKSINQFKGLAAALIAVVAAIWILGKTPTDVLVQGGLAVAAILGIMAAVLSAVGKSTKGSSFKSIIAMLIGFGLLLAEMGYIVKKLSEVGWQNAIGSALALSTLLLAMSYCMRNLTKHSNGSKNIYKWVGAMAVFGLVVLELAAIIAAMRDVDPLSAMGQVVALGVLMNAMSYCMTSLTKHRTGAKNIYKWVGAMAVFGLVVLELGAVLHAIQKLGVNPTEAIGQVVALGLLMAAMSACLAIISAIHLDASRVDDVLIGVAALALMAAPLYLFAQVLSSMSGLEGAIKNATALSILALALSVALVPLTIVGYFAASALAGIIALTLIAVPLCAFVGILAWMEGIQNASENVKVLTTLIGALSGMMVILAVTGPLALVGVVALSGLCGLILKFGALVTAIGWLMGEFPTIETFLDTGIEILKKLASGLGEVIGCFITSFGVSVSEGLITIAENLATFAEKLTPFIGTIKSIDNKVLSGVDSLVSMITSLTGAKIIDSIGDTSGLEYFGGQLKGFGDGICDFANSVSGLSKDTVVKAKIAADTGAVLADLAKNLSGSGGAWQDFWGEKNLDTFGTQMAGFGESLVTFSGSISDLTDDDLGHITAVANAVQPLVTIATSISNTDGLWQKVTGTKDLGTFGEKLAEFGGSVKEFSDSISDVETPDINKISAIGNAVGPLADVSTKISAEDGAWQAITGTKDLGSFGSKLGTFGKGIKTFLTSIEGIVVDTASTSIQNVSALIDEIDPVIDKIGSSDGLWQKVVGEKDVGGFGTSLIQLGRGIADFVAKASTIAENENAITSIQSVGTAIEEINTVMGLVGDEYNTEALSAAISSLSQLNSLAVSMSGTDYSGLGNFAEAFGGIGDAGVNAFVSAFNGLAEKVNVAMGSVLSVISSYTSVFMTAGTTLMNSLVNGISLAASGMTVVYSVINSIVAPLLSYDMALIGYTFICKLASGLQLGIETNLNTVAMSAAVMIPTKMLEYTDAGGGKTKMMDIGKKLLSYFVLGVKGEANNIRTTLMEISSQAAAGLEDCRQNWTGIGEKLGEAIAEGLSSKQGDMESAGSNVAQGAIDGAYGKWQAVYDAGYALGQAMVAGFNAGAIICSPSKLTYKSGVFAAMGAINALSDYTSKVYNAGYDSGNTMVTGLGDAVSKISNIVDDNIDSQPTIRPVLDLDNISNGVNAMNNMFGLNPSVALLGNVGSINAAMANRQNGSYDVVSAIKDLGNKIKNNSGDTYNIEGITYDDGSNISEAVQTLVRAVKIERRK